MNKKKKGFWKEFKEWHKRNNTLLGRFFELIKYPEKIHIKGEEVYGYR